MKTELTDSPEDDDVRETDRWTVADLIDLEYFLDADEQMLHEGTAARSALTERDRTLYLNRIAPAVTTTRPHTTLHRRRSLRRWLRERRAAERPERRLLLPGRIFAQALRLTTLGLAVLGFLIGIGAASALLSYDGHRPINVALYIFFLVFVQFLFMGVGTVAWLVRRARPLGQAVRDLSLLGRLIRPLVTRVSHWLMRQHLAATRQDVNDRTATQVGRLRSQFALYGSVSFLPILIPAQVFGVAFNLGVILTTLWLEWFTDLGFGWQTALDLSPQFIHDLARAVSAPWGWLFGEGVGYPSLEQVAGSRILLKDPLSLLDADHLRSWRWFLVLAVCTYGLLPRLLLLGASLLTQRHLLERQPFTQGRTQALYARLLTPMVQTATHGSGHGTAMPIPAPVTHQGPLARPIAAPTHPPTAPHPTDQVAVTESRVVAPQNTPVPVADRGRPAPERPDPEPTLLPTTMLDAAGAQPAAPRPASEPTAAPLEPRGTEVPDGIAADACLVLVQFDVDVLIDDAQRPRVAELVRTLTGWRVAASASFGSGSAMTAGMANWIKGQRWLAPPARVAVIMDGSQPPITENLRFLRELRAAAGTQAQVLLALVGDPQDDDPLPPVRTFDFTDWQRKIVQLADPYLRLDMLVPGGVDGDA
jgi:hypothetical protein